MTIQPLPVALTIAGSDSGGGAGIQADLKTFHAFGVFGTTALTAVTAQNTLGVQAIHPVPIDVVRAQVDSVVDDLKPGAVKSGMLATSELVRAVADALRHHGMENYVLDPVMVATSGHRLLARDAEAALVSELLPLCRLVTPNLEEARILTGHSVDRLEDMRTAARALLDLGASAALVKGGHLGSGAGGGAEAIDFFWDGSREIVWRRARMDTRHTHGTGCTLSAGVAAGLARGLALEEATAQAVDFVARAIATAPGLGSGHGPVNHFAGTVFAPGIADS